MVRYDMDMAARGTLGEVGRLHGLARSESGRAQQAGAAASRCFGTATTARSRFLAFLVRAGGEADAVLAEVETRRRAVDEALTSIEQGDREMAATADRASSEVDALAEGRLPGLSTRAMLSARSLGGVGEEGPA